MILKAGSLAPYPHVSDVEETGPADLRKMSESEVQALMKEKVLTATLGPDGTPAGLPKTSGVNAGKRLMFRVYIY